jgi:hypothetical protein
MEGNGVSIRFQTPYQYVFIHNNVKHLLLLWEKEHKRQLYIVEEEADEMLLLFPGDSYTETVLDQIEPILFQRLETDAGPFLAVLGATFTYDERKMVMYYHPEHPDREIYFFEWSGDGIAELDEEEYEAVTRAFINEFPEFFPDEP